MADPRPPRVLVVDDEEHVRGVLCEALATWGCEVQSAPGAAQALAVFAEGGYDLVLTDFRMPNGDGLDLIEGLRRADPSVAVIMLTASSDDLDASSRRLEFAVLRKPLEFDALRLAVDAALGRRAQGTIVAGR